MSDTINIQEILNKHCGKHRFDSMEIEDISSAIKEIVEAVVDKCAEECKTVTTDSCTGELYRNTVPSGYDVHESVDKESILQVKQMINYE